MNNALCMHMYAQIDPPTLLDHWPFVFPTLEPISAVRRAPYSLPFGFCSQRKVGNLRNECRSTQDVGGLILLSALLVSVHPTVTLTGVKVSSQTSLQMEVVINLGQQSFGLEYRSMLIAFGGNLDWCLEIVTGTATCVTCAGILCEAANHRAAHDLAEHGGQQRVDVWSLSACRSGLADDPKTPYQSEPIPKEKSLCDSASSRSRCGRQGLTIVYKKSWDRIEQLGVLGKPAMPSSSMGYLS